MTVGLLSAGILPHRGTAGELVGVNAYLGTSARVLWWFVWYGGDRLCSPLLRPRRSQEARLIQDLIVAGVYLGVAPSIIGWAYSPV